MTDWSKVKRPTDELYSRAYGRWDNAAHDAITQLREGVKQLDDRTVGQDKRLFNARERLIKLEAQVNDLPDEKLNLGEGLKDQPLFDRWLGTLRFKARKYEHPARKRGEVVESLTLDDVCNEIDAYLTGRLGHSQESGDVEGGDGTDSDSCECSDEDKLDFQPRGGHSFPEACLEKNGVTESTPSPVEAKLKERDWEHVERLASWLEGVPVESVHRKKLLEAAEILGVEVLGDNDDSKTTVRRQAHE